MERRQVTLELMAPGHTRLVQLECREQPPGTIFVQQTTGPRETLAPANRVRVHEDDRADAFDNDLVAELLAHGYRVVDALPNDAGLADRLGAEVERRRSEREGGIAAAIAALEALPGLTTTRGRPLSASEVDALEAKVGVPLSASYRSFLTTIGAFHVSIDAEDQLWLLGASLCAAGRELSLPSAAAELAPLLAARHQEIAAHTSRLAPKRVVPLIVKGHDLTSTCGFDDAGRLCECSLRHAEVTVIGDTTLWNDFADRAELELRRFERHAREYFELDGDDEAEEL